MYLLRPLPSRKTIYTRQKIHTAGGYTRNTHGDPKIHTDTHGNYTREEKIHTEIHTVRNTHGNTRLHTDTHGKKIHTDTHGRRCTWIHTYTHGYTGIHTNTQILT